MIKRWGDDTCCTKGRLRERERVESRGAESDGGARKYRENISLLVYRIFL